SNPTAGHRCESSTAHAWQTNPHNCSLETKLKPEWPDQQHVRQVDERAKQSYKRVYDNKHDVKTLPGLQPGTVIAVKLDSERGASEKSAEEQNE
ncbi:hypothetical protein JOQ06_009703, partial [Pogonophryne albipinna]